MEARTLTISVQPDWQAALRSAGKAAQSETYQGETLNFESAHISTYLPGQLADGDIP